MITLTIVLALLSFLVATDPDPSETGHSGE
jgi:hypothetical protein